MRRRTVLSALLLIGSAIVSGADWDAARQRLAQAYPGVQLYAQGELPTRVYGAILGLGPTPELSADAFVREHSAVLGVSADELEPGNASSGDYTLPLMFTPETGTYKFTLVCYRQVRDGIPVYRSDLRLLVRNEPDFPLVLAASSLKDLGTFAVSAAAVRSSAHNAAIDAALKEAPSLTDFGAPDLVIYAGSDDESAPPRLAITFVADNYGSPTATRPERYRFVADASTGVILHKEDLIILTDVTGNVSGMATTIPKSDTCNPEVSTPMKYATVTIGATSVYADTNGNFTVPNAGSSAVTVSSPMSGHYFFVSVLAGTLDALSQSVTPPGPANFVHNSANSDELVRAQINAYVQANVVRDWVLTYDPNYPVISTDVNFPLYVNRTDGYCPGNAWYDGSSLNFCSSSGSYPNTAYSSVVHHEYGHHAVQSGGSGQDQYGEGMGDCFAVCLADDPILGYGFTGNCSAGIRTADNTMQYPCTSDIHTCAQLLSGCIWSTRNALRATNPSNYLAILSSLLINSVPLHAGGSITPQITIDFLTLDDNDGDISNGTPHYNEICTGFGAHGMTCPALAPLAFSFPNGRPDPVSPAGGTTLRVVVSALSSQPQPGTGQFYYKIGSGSWSSTPMQVAAPNVYDAIFPATTCGSVVSYYFSAQTTTAQIVYNPTNAPTGFYVATSATATTTVLADDMEIDRGWTVGDPNDTATTGIWDRDIPEATPAQPASDHTPDPGVRCWVTDHRAGLSIGDYDVDNGKTTLKSPILNLAGYSAAKISYWRWYSNNQGSSPNADTFRVDISNNNGTSWVNAETVGPSGTGTGGGWYYHEFNVGSFVALTSQVKLRFIAEDAGAGSIIEAAVDDFLCVGYSCAIQYTLTTSVTGQGSIALNPPGGVYNSGTTVQLTANPATGWHFDHWTGSLSGSTNPASLLMDGNKSATAVFVINQYTLTAGVTGQGTVAFSPPGGVYDAGTTVQLTANAAAGWHFDHWEGALSGSANPASLLMDDNKSVTAVFVQNPLGCPGDVDCDGRVTFADIDRFVEALAGQSSWTHAPCPWRNADCNRDLSVNFADIDPFVALIGTTCP